MSKIEWTEETWNPVVGCTRVSVGCDHCYAAVMTRRLASMPATREIYEGLVNEGKGHFNGTVRCLEDRLDIPLKWRKPRVVFVNSMSDLFHRSVPDSFILRVWNVMRRCPQHTFQILTKRGERMRRTVPWLYDVGEEPLPNVWLGVSVEGPDVLGRIEDLRRTPAAVRFLSCEPLLADLGDLDLKPEAEICPACEGGGTPEWAIRQHEVVCSYYSHDLLDDGRGGAQCNSCGYVLPFCPECNETPGKFYPASIDWVIVGGESGPGARPMHPEWARGIRDQCVAAGVPFFFKQWGEWGPGYTGVGDHPKVKVRRLDAGFTVKRYGKKRAGRLLDGRVWDQMPGVNEADKGDESCQQAE